MDIHPNQGISQGIHRYLHATELKPLIEDITLFNMLMLMENSLKMDGAREPHDQIEQKYHKNKFLYNTHLMN